MEISLIFYYSASLFISCIILTSAKCIPPLCFNIEAEENSKTFEIKNSSWTIFCYDGKSEQILLLWSNPVLKIQAGNGTTESFQFIVGDTPENVEEKKESTLQLPQVLQNLKFMFNLADLKDLSFSPFNKSCIGIHSNQKYTAAFKYKNNLSCMVKRMKADFTKLVQAVRNAIDFLFNVQFNYGDKTSAKVSISEIAIELWYVAYLALGVLVFLYAKQLSQNVKLQYGTGISLGIVASLLILMIILHRVFPQSLKKLGYLMVISSCCASMYFWQLFATSFSTTILSYWKWILGYIAAMGFISFGVCYKYGPITDQKNLNILQWMIQALGLILIYQGTQIPHLSAAFIIVILTIYNLPSGTYNNGLTRYLRFKLFRPKIKLLTEEEYQRQGYEETRKALEELRSFCQSPDCKPWKVISKLKSPDRFASFVEGDSWHVTDQELLEYDSVQDGEVPTDNEEEELEENLISEDEISD